MTKEGDPTEGKLISGAIPDLPTIPDLNSVMALEWVESRAEEMVPALENERLLNESLLKIVAPFEARIFAAASSRLANDEYEPKKKRKKEKTSKWKGDGKNNWVNWFAEYKLGFNTNWRQNKVEEVNSFRMNSRGSSVIISLEKGKVTDVAYESASTVHHPWEKSSEPDASTPWGEWLDDVVIDRGIRAGVWERGQHMRYPRTKDRVTFDISLPSLKISAFYDPNRAFQVWVGGPPPTRPLDEIYDLWKFNPQRNRFNHEYEMHKRTLEEVEAELSVLSPVSPELDALVMESSLKHSVYKQAILSSSEYTQGLGLLLDTIPLEPV